MSLLAGVPEHVGLALAGELYSPSLDQIQRCLILDSLSSAAAEIAHPGSVLMALPGPTSGSGSGGGGAGLVKAAAPLPPQQLPPQQLLQQKQQQPAPLLPATTADGSKRLGRVTRVAPRSLAVKQQMAAAAGVAAQHRNIFPPLALKWAAALLKECDR